MALDQLKAFILAMQADEELKRTVLAASTADDVAKIANRKGFEFSGDELLRFNGQKVGKVTVVTPDHPGEYHLCREQPNWCCSAWRFSVFRCGGLAKWFWLVQGSQGRWASRRERTHCRGNAMLCRESSITPDHRPVDCFPIGTRFHDCNADFAPDARAPEASD